MMRRTRVPQHIEDAILVLAAEQPSLGRVRVAAELNKRGLEATASTVRSVWQRHGLQNTEKRIAAFAAASQLATVAQPSPAETISPLTAEEAAIIPAPHEIAAATRPAPGFMADALVFSVAVLTAIAHDTAPIDHLDTSGLPSSDPIAAILGEDHGVVAATDAPADTVDILQFAGTHSDLIAA
jgi:hypothetical protein